jgi:hypothetical protein
MEAGQVLNRETFLHFLDLEVKRARRYQNFFCLITLKILGSLKKSQELQSCYLNLLHWLKQESRESDVLASLGQDQLVVLLPYADLTAGRYTLSRFQNSLRFFDFENEGYQVRMGQICFPKDGTDTEELIRKVLDAT